MARSYKFAIVRLAPEDGRDERLNIGALVVTDDGLDVRVSRRLEKIRAVSMALDAGDLKELIQQLQTLDAQMRESGIEDEEERLRLLSRVGPLSLSASGTFLADSAGAYDSRVAAILRVMVDPEPPVARTREKRSRLLTQMKIALRRERVLARPGEDLGSHRIVPGVLMDEGLVADLVLKNGVVHIVDTVDASSETELPRKALGDIGISALVLERARMKFGSQATTRLVYSASASLERIAQPSLEAAHNQGAELVNWASAEQRGRFLSHFTALAEPIPPKRRRRHSARDDQQLLFR